MSFMCFSLDSENGAYLFSIYRFFFQGGIDFEPFCNFFDVRRNYVSPTWTEMVRFPYDKSIIG